jgi:hypothetical protein
MSFDSFPRVERDAQFAPPEKKINSAADVLRFNTSVTFQRIVGFIQLLNESIKGKTCLDEDILRSSTIVVIGDVLDTLNNFIDEIPPSTGPRRFGNVAFRDWIRRLEEVIVHVNDGLLIIAWFRATATKSPQRGSSCPCRNYTILSGFFWLGTTSGLWNRS